MKRVLDFFMAYVGGKIYIPRVIAEAVGLLREAPDEVLERFLEEPLEIGVPVRIRRREFYEGLC
ncbi:MAG: hypothetical protein DRJ55_05805 [Thermoprotei archaeon]|nr:MAG: hypothetical protein DRJ55_05805 [Thermoprotei archaeon]